MDDTTRRPESATPNPTRVLPADEVPTVVTPVDRTPPAPPQAPSPAAPGNEAQAPSAPAWGSVATTDRSSAEGASPTTDGQNGQNDRGAQDGRPAADGQRAADTRNAPDGERAHGSPNGSHDQDSSGSEIPSAPAWEAAAPVWGSNAPQDPGTDVIMMVPPAGMSPDAAQATAGTGEIPNAIPASLLARMKADPTHAPEFLALAAVERFGPEAALWMARTRAAHPYVADRVWVPVIKTRFVRLSKYSGAAAGAAGAIGAVVDVGVLAWNQARMVLHIAAALGYDPTHPDRAAELLVIRGLQPAVDAARTAIDVARRQQDPTALTKHLPDRIRNFGSGAGRAYSELAWQLARMAGLAAVKKMAMKFVPFAGVPLGAMANSSATKKLADDALKYYTTHHPPRALPPAPPPAQ
ncbi:EcsC family protein [Cryptosporangium aurantiacum]|uniref:EcsC protein family protein n=1 Tax=Cryptosporangium aurantiacum TaxID=134849 RepID=A0A1M7NQK6_9ACTN|nr:EcsC family protein [Cryptosporangium aurantiacum]SHN06337.1 EcsC protein family protein [Cryptosporangium aurantiacum]